MAGVSELPWPDDSFDRACSMNTLMLWPDLRSDLAEVSRVTAPDGRIVLAVRDHFIERKHGGMTRDEIDAVRQRLGELGWDASLEHDGPVAFVVADGSP